MGPILRCDSHPNSVLIEDHRAGDMICSMCGLVVGDRIVDVSSEWRKLYRKEIRKRNIIIILHFWALIGTFANDTESKDMCRVGAVEDPTLGGADLTTSIGRATGSAGFDENGRPIYRNKFSVF